MKTNPYTGEYLIGKPGIVKCWYQKEAGYAIQRGYGLAYSDFCCAFDVYYPIPLNLIVRYWRKFYWGFLRFFYHIGLIDTKLGNEFRWNDFFRIRMG